MINKRTIIATLVLVLAMVLAACGTPATQAPDPEPTDPPVVEEPTDEPVMEDPTDEPVMEEPDVTLTIWADDTRASTLEQLGAAFEAEYGVAIEVVLVGFGDIRTNLQVQGPAGEGPDILIGAHDWLGELVASGLLAPVDLGALESQFTEPALQAFNYEGTLYGMPYAVENVAFFRNTDLVPDAPATWTEVREISEELVNNGDSQYGYVLQINDAYHFFPIMTAFGGYVFGLNADGTYNPADVGIDSEGTIAAAQYLESMVTDGLLSQDVDWDTMHALFESGEAAMMISGPWALDRIRDSGVPYAISAIPSETATSAPFLGVQGFMISAFSENVELATAFLTEFVATEAVMSELYVSGGRPSAFIPVADAIDDADLAAFNSAAAEGLPMPAIPQMGSVWGSWGDAITLVFQAQQPADEAFENAAEQIRAAIESGS